MVSFPNAKINLGLNIVEKRNDGYHNIETVFYPVGWKDVLEIIPAQKKINRKRDVHFHSSGIKISGGAKKNTCILAYEMLREKYSLPPVEMHLHKIIPAGAGLGGGSADAAFTLLMLNNIFQLEIPPDKLEMMAARIGADCAFFIRNHPVFARGIGNEFEDVVIDLSAYKIAIVKPDVHVSTASAYKGVIPKTPAKPIADVIRIPVEQWRNELVNDFELSVFKKYPIIEHIKSQMYDAGAVYASMSGSGSAVFGIFSEPTDLTEKFKGYYLWQEQSFD